LIVSSYLNYKSVHSSFTGGSVAGALEDYLPSSPLVSSIGEHLVFSILDPPRELGTGISREDSLVGFRVIFAGNDGWCGISRVGEQEGVLRGKLRAVLLIQRKIEGVSAWRSRGNSLRHQRVPF
jgi:hypothetical protein